MISYVAWPVKHWYPQLCGVRRCCYIYLLNHARHPQNPPDLSTFHRHGIKRSDCGTHGDDWALLRRGHRRSEYAHSECEYRAERREAGLNVVRRHQSTQGALKSYRLAGKTVVLIFPMIRPRQKNCPSMCKSCKQLSWSIRRRLNVQHLQRPLSNSYRASSIYILSIANFLC